MDDANPKKVGGMRKNLPLEELSGLLTQPRCAVLATNYADGTTLLSPVLVRVARRRIHHRHL